MANLEFRSLTYIPEVVLEAALVWYCLINSILPEQMLYGEGRRINWLFKVEKFVDGVILKRTDIVHFVEFW